MWHVKRRYLLNLVWILYLVWIMCQVLWLKLIVNWWILMDTARFDSSCQLRVIGGIRQAIMPKLPAEKFHFTHRQQMIECYMLKKLSVCIVPKVTRLCWSQFGWTMLTKLQCWLKLEPTFLSLTMVVIQYCISVHLKAMLTWLKLVLSADIILITLCNSCGPKIKLKSLLNNGNMVVNIMFNYSSKICLQLENIFLEWTCVCFVCYHMQVRFCF